MTVDRIPNAGDLVKNRDKIIPKKGKMMITDKTHSYLILFVNNEMRDKD